MRKSLIAMPEFINAKVIQFRIALLLLPSFWISVTIKWIVLFGYCSQKISFSKLFLMFSANSENSLHRIWLTYRTLCTPSFQWSWKEPLYMWYPAIILFPTASLLLFSELLPDNLARPFDNAHDFCHTLFEVAGPRSSALDSQLDDCAPQLVELAAVGPEGGQIMDLSIDHMNCISTSSGSARQYQRHNEPV